ncbi:hypothetical protein PIB30_078230, partial [Stylosanthes scabra]|nr:hypothetical protein [Stylosanthes scabra]
DDAPTPRHQHLRLGISGHAQASRISIQDLDNPRLGVGTKVQAWDISLQATKTSFNKHSCLGMDFKDLCIPGASWRLSSGQPAQLIQLRRAELTPLARGWQEFIIHSIIPTGNKSEITIARAMLIHSIIKGEDIRVEELIVDNIAVIAQGMQGKGKLAFLSTIYKLCKDAQVPMHEFRRNELILQDKPITTRLMETTRLGRNVQVQQKQNEEEDQPMPHFEGGNEEGHDQGQH